MEDNTDNNNDPVDKELKESIVTNDIKEQINKDSKKMYIILGLIFCSIALIVVIIILIYFLNKDSDSDSENNNPDDSNKLKFLSWTEAHKEAQKVEVTIFDANGTESGWFVDAAKKSCFATLEIYEDYVIEDHVNKDGSVTEYICWR